MPIYEYRHCDKRFEVLKPMAECANGENCPECGEMAARVYSPFIDIWPQILTEASHHKGATDEWVQDRPSNNMIVDNSKAPKVKTIFLGG